MARAQVDGPCIRPDCVLADKAYKPLLHWSSYLGRVGNAVSSWVATFLGIG